VSLCRFRAPLHFFVVHKYAVDDLLDNRTTWQWTDAIYQIENTSYAKQ
jgi:hypothetical protein